MQDPPSAAPSDGTDRRPGPRGPARRVAVAVGLAAVFVAAVYLSTLRLGSAPTASRAGDASAGAIGTVMEGAGIGQSAPDFVAAEGEHQLLLDDLDGKPIRLRDFAGKPLWIVFWATWCTPCQEEASDIRASFRAHRDDDLAVLAVDIQEPAAAVREFALSHDLDYRIGLDATAGVRALYGGLGLPAHFFLDGNGVIRDRYFGQMTRELMEQHLRAIIGS
jgi:cytochrome c biogenesis protein CcmG/thiol:disulfide interchange protein DsbE